MVVSLMKKLPSKYKNFTTFPEKMKDKIKSEIEGDKKRIWDKKVKVGKPYAIAAGILLFIMILSLSFNLGMLLLLSIVGLIVTGLLLKKALKSDNDVNF